MTDDPRFAHASEAELARILDYYGIRWQYEPHTFPIQWNLDGTVVESFTPDFYLPDLDLYVELTTLKQSLVRRKNRKLRRLRELYPDVRVKLFYGKDFKALMLKYGRLDLAASLSGLEGQALADRRAEPITGGLAASVTVADIADAALALDAQAVDAAPAVEAPPAVDAAPAVDAPAAASATPETADREPARRLSRGSRRRRGRRHYSTAA